MDTTSLLANRGIAPALFNELFDRAPGKSLLLSPGAPGTFAVDIEETPDGYVVTANLPGVSKECCEVTVVRGRLQVSVTPPHERGEASGKQYLRRERPHGRMSRTFTLPHVQPDGVEASLKDGVLTVSARKEDSALPRRILIN